MKILNIQIISEGDALMVGIHHHLSHAPLVHLPYIVHVPLLNQHLRPINHIRMLRT